MISIWAEHTFIYYRGRKQSKNLFQAEIDSASEMVDFLNFNVAYAQQIYEDQVTMTSYDS